jgi:hypothetical protein
MRQNTAFLTISLVFMLSFLCCCCGGLGGEQLQELMAGNLDTLMEEAADVQVDLDELVGTPTPAAEPGDVQEEAAEAAPEGAPAEESAEMPADEPGQEDLTDLIPEVPDIEGDGEQAAQDILEAIEEQLAQEGDQPFSFGCDDPNIPMPNDVEGCVSVAGFTTYSTAMSEAEINQLYDDYFLSQGWEHFPEAIQEDVLNAWANEGVQGVALLSFTAGGGENGKNMVNLAVIAE